MTAAYRPVRELLQQERIKKDKVITLLAPPSIFFFFNKFSTIEYIFFADFSFYRRRNRNLMKHKAQRMLRMPKKKLKKRKKLF